MADTIDWAASGGRKYRYWFVTPTAEGLAAVGGNYAFVKQLANGNFTPLYFGQADNLKTRIPGHERLSDAHKAGMTHVMGHTTPAGEQARLAEEKDLIGYWNPPLNTHHRQVS